MTTINSQEDFLRALAENPQWKEAVRAQLLGEGLLQFPDKFDTFAEEQKQHNARMDAFVEEQKQHNARMDAFVERIAAVVEEQKRHNDRMDRRMTTLSNDVGQAKGGYARFFTVQYGPVLIMELNWDRNLGLEYVRDVTRVEIASMAQKATGGDIPTPELRSFGRADLIVEATQGGDTCYIAVEASFTGDQRDASRAQRNAALLTRFTGKPAYAVVASVRNDNDAAAEIAAGNVWWLELEEREMNPE